jgi:hypothetical protein
MPRLAIATVQAIERCEGGICMLDRTSSERTSCGLVKWCTSVSTLLRLPSLAAHAEALILTNHAEIVRSLCFVRSTTLRIVPLHQRLVAASQHWARHLRAINFSMTAWTRQVSIAALYKWQVFAHVEYEAVFYTDADVDLLAHSWQLKSHARFMTVLNETWTTGLREFLAETRVRMVASPDFHSPINTGVLLVKPSLAVFEQGVGLLERGRFDRNLGFAQDGRAHIGRPRHALAHLERTAPSMWADIRKTVMVKANDWSFVGGHACQGLFVYCFLANGSPQDLSQPISGPGSTTQLSIRFPRPTIARRAANQSGMMRVHHFVGSAKPWRGGARSVCKGYFSGHWQQAINDALAATAARRNDSVASAAGSCCRVLAERQRCVARRSLSESECRYCRRNHARYKRPDCTGGAIDACPGIAHLVV